jgi:hypothetical protein
LGQANTFAMPQEVEKRGNLQQLRRDREGLVLKKKSARTKKNSGINEAARIIA